MKQPSSTPTQSSGDREGKEKRNNSLEILNIVFWVFMLSVISLCLLAFLAAAMFPVIVNHFFLRQ